MKLSGEPELVEFPEQTIVIAKNQKQYRPLPAHIHPKDNKGTVTCCWELSLLDRVKLLFTGRLWHQILTFKSALQPQLLLTKKPEMPPPNLWNYGPNDEISYE